MIEQQHPRTDHKTEAEVREAMAMRRAFGLDAAREFLKLRGVDQELANRVIEAKPDRLRY
jgi:hypothetical protein